MKNTETIIEVRLKDGEIVRAHNTTGITRAVEEVMERARLSDGLYYLKLMKTVAGRRTPGVRVEEIQDEKQKVVLKVQGPQHRYLAHLLVGDNYAAIAKTMRAVDDSPKKPNGRNSGLSHNVAEVDIKASEKEANLATLFGDDSTFQLIILEQMERCAIMVGAVRGFISLQEITKTLKEVGVDSPNNEETALLMIRLYEYGLTDSHDDYSYCVSEKGMRWLEESGFDSQRILDQKRATEISGMAEVSRSYNNDVVRQDLLASKSAALREELKAIMDEEKQVEARIQKNKPRAIKAQAILAKIDLLLLTEGA